ncbi:hypothetical protein RFI_15116 [Reticulomyxa filosa]|uniref:Uncharacterized protein n=1 Tax=Reticulomyxa filosa TaxID=46433 RepID=X6N840_RETFI|nr:hypothetical protein RFI_15116 [Reticulomyxa filosa]|eukprot:ETO22088.1 hypothetical protein RFI_15116 [Reticulomyxa filosa]
MFIFKEDLKMHFSIVVAITTCKEMFIEVSHLQKEDFNATSYVAIEFEKKLFPTNFWCETFRPKTTCMTNNKQSEFVQSITNSEILTNKFQISFVTFTSKVIQEQNPTNKQEYTFSYQGKNNKNIPTQPTNKPKRGVANQTSSQQTQTLSLEGVSHPTFPGKKINKITKQKSKQHQHTSVTCFKDKPQKRTNEQINKQNKKND